MDDTIPAELSELIGLIYDCAFDPQAWPRALAATSAFIQGNRVRLFLFNADAGQPGDGTSIGVDRDFNHSFDRDAETLASIKYGFVVAELDQALTLEEILGASGGRDVNGRLPYDNRFYKEWMEPRGAHDALAVLTFKTPHRFGGLAMTRSTPLPPFGATEKQKIRLLAPHVRRALTISELLEERRVARDELADIIDAMTIPVIIVDSEARIHDANRAARALLSGDGVLADVNGALSGRHPAATARLREAISDAGGARIATIALPDAGATGAILSVLRLGATGGGRRAVFVHSASAPPQLPGEAFAKLYQLTGTELHIVMLLIEGASIAQIAKRLGSAVETVRWHLKNLRAKTGCARQSDIIRLATRAILPLAGGG